MDKQHNLHSDAECIPTAPVDFNLLLDLLGAAEAAEVLEVFQVSTEQHLAKISAALGYNDLQQVKEAIHTLKGACSSIGASRMWLTCIEFEKAAKSTGEDAMTSSDWSQLSQTLTMLEQDFAQARTFIEQFGPSA